LFTREILDEEKPRADEQNKRRGLVFRRRCKSAEWVPYFKNRDTYYTTEDPKTRISLYCHPGKDAFLIVGNTDAQTRTVNVQLRLKAFGLAVGALRARNALTQVPVALTQDGKLNVPVRTKSFVLVAVEPNP
jgi:hypothetical protein